MASISQTNCNPRAHMLHGSHLLSPFVNEAMQDTTLMQLVVIALLYIFSSSFLPPLHALTIFIIACSIADSLF